MDKPRRPLLPAAECAYLRSATRTGANLCRGERPFGRPGGRASWVTAGSPSAITSNNAQTRDAFREGAQSSGKDPNQQPVLVESFVIVGGRAGGRDSRSPVALRSGGLQLLEDPDPRDIQRRAEQEVKLEDVYRKWVVGEDAEVHVRGIEKFVEAGATDVFIHSPQSDQQRVIDFYAREVLPRVRQVRAAA